MTSIRNSFLEELRSHSDQNLYCRTLLEDGEALEVREQPDMWQMYAKLWLLQTQNYVSSVEADSFVADIEKQLSRLKAREARQVQSSLASHFSRFKAFDKAISSLNEALKGERDPDLRAIQLRNLAKIYLVKGDLASAMQTCNRFRTVGQVGAAGVASLKLLRARILLNLAADAEAKRELASIDVASLEAWHLGVEYHYLQAALCSQVSGSFSEELVKLLANIDAKHEAAIAFYELEAEAFKLFERPRSIKNKQAFEARVRYLARIANWPWMAKFLPLAVELLRDKKVSEQPETVDRFLKTMEEYQKSDHEISFQRAGILLTESFLKAGSVKLAGQCLQMVYDQIQKQRGQLPRSLLTKLEQSPSQILETVSALNRKINPKYRIEEECDWLLGA